MTFQIEYVFTLPTGLVDGDGIVHRKGVMRLATAADEILPQKDPRVQSNPAYLDIVLLSRVIKFESLPGKNGDFGVDSAVIEKLFVQDLAYLQELYRRINAGEGLALSAKCPECKETVEVSLSPGEDFGPSTPETEFKFTLPCGFVEESRLHKDGVMRLATAGDEILPQKDPRVQSNPAYLPVIALARVVTKLGSLADVNPRIIEGLFAQDLHFLEELYGRVNGGEELLLKTRCWNCEEKVEVKLMPGES